MPPICPYCATAAVLVADTEVYQVGYGKMVWLCRPCKAWVGCHRDSKDHKPLGRLANAELRALKIRAHAGFDPIWRAAMLHRKWPKGKARGMAYKWLAKQMGINAKDCHIGMMDEQQSRAVAEICSAIGRKA